MKVTGDILFFSDCMSQQQENSLKYQIRRCRAFIGIVQMDGAGVLLQNRKTNSNFGNKLDFQKSILSLLSRVHARF